MPVAAARDGVPTAMNTASARTSRPPGRREIEPPSPIFSSDHLCSQPGLETRHLAVLSRRFSPRLVDQATVAQMRPKTRPTETRPTYPVPIMLSALSAHPPSISNLNASQNGGAATLFARQRACVVTQLRRPDTSKMRQFTDFSIGLVTAEQIYRQPRLQILAQSWIPIPSSFDICPRAREGGGWGPLVEGDPRIESGCRGAADEIACRRLCTSPR